MIAANIMTTETTLYANDSLLDALRLLGTGEAGGAVAVVGPGGRVVGLVTPKGLLERAVGSDPAGLGKMALGQVVENTFATVGPGADLKTVSIALANAGTIGAVAVVDNGDRFLGLITHRDMLRRIWEYSEKKKVKKG